ncbi:MAG: SLBB domain-containing protein [Bacteroidota bacterium]
MKQTFLYLRIFFLIALLAQVNFSSAQTAGIPEEILSKIPADRLPQLEERVQSLQGEGLDQAAILDRLRGEGLIPDIPPQAVESGETQEAAPAPGSLEAVERPTPQAESAAPDEASSATGAEEPSTEKKSLPRSGIFGHQIFENPGEFNPGISSTPPFSYIIGPGDVFGVNVWGCSELNETLTVEEDGYVSRKFIGRVQVAGLTYGRVRSLLIAKYRQIVASCSQIEVFIGSSQRTLNVNIVGEVFKPGAYKINAAVPAFNALFEAGGINALGTVRDIEIRRAGRTIRRLDLYEYLIAGVDEPIYLQDNDRIFVPLQGKVVGIGGPVIRPLKYELRPDENLLSLIAYAGGLRPNARPTDAQLSRIENDESVLLDLNLNDFLEVEGQDYPLFDGDLLTVKSLREELVNIVQISGRVKYPDTYQLRPGETVRDLITKAGGLEEDAYLDRAYVQRTNQETNEIRYLPLNLTRAIENDDPAHNLQLTFFDQLRIFSQTAFREQHEIAIQGKVNAPGSFKVGKEMNLKDVLYLAGGFVMDDAEKELELYRSLDPEERGFNNLGQGRPEVLRIRMGENWQASNIADTVQLIHYDRIVVRSNADFIRTGEVTAKGLFNNPGTFQVLPDMSLLDVLYLAGGLKLEADVENIELYRVIEKLGENGELIPVPIVERRISTQQNWREDSSLASIKVNTFDQIFVRKNPAFELQESVTIQGEVITPGEYNKLAKAERLSSLISRAGGITDLADLEGAYLVRKNIGNVAIKLDKALRRPKSKYDIPLLVGDQIVVPPRVDVVTINGNVLRPGVTVLYEKNKPRLRYYVNLAGGFDRKSKKKRSTVTYVDGRVKRGRNILGFKFFPKIEQGSVIEVAQKPKKEPKPEGEGKKLKLDELLAGATAILTFFLLIDRTVN